MGVGGSDVEQQAQYHPRGVSSALLFTINAFWFPARQMLGTAGCRVAGMLWGKTEPRRH